MSIDLNKYFAWIYLFIQSTKVFSRNNQSFSLINKYIGWLYINAFIKLMEANFCWINLTFLCVR